MAPPEIYWEGKSGTRYRYWIYRLGTTFEDKPGNYIYAQEIRPDRWTARYIGQTGSLKVRLADHEKEACAKRNGATHVHVHASSAIEAGRRAEESDLIARWKPVCNG